MKVRNFKDFEKSLKDLLDGYTTMNIDSLLGVSFVKLGKEALVNGKNLIFFNSYHAVYADGGYYDETKSASGYSPNVDFAASRFGIKCLLYLCRPNNRVYAIR